jgi:hypothetical protein
VLARLRLNGPRLFDHEGPDSNRDSNLAGMPRFGDERSGMTHGRRGHPRTVAHTLPGPMDQTSTPAPGPTRPMSNKLSSTTPPIDGSTTTDTPGRSFVVDRSRHGGRASLIRQRSVDSNAVDRRQARHAKGWTFWLRLASDERTDA